MRVLAAVAALALTAASTAEAREVRLAGAAAVKAAPGLVRQVQPDVKKPVFSLPNYQIVMVTSASGSQKQKAVSGACPAGMKAVSGSANGRSTYPEPSGGPYDDAVTVEPPLSLFGYARGLSDVVSGPTKDGNGWSASGRLPVVNSDWVLELTIVCVRI